MSGILDYDGENRAVRSFLMLYAGGRSVTVSQMREHMELAGWENTDPEFVSFVHGSTTLTKAGAQIWIRHLFSLETAE